MRIASERFGRGEGSAGEAEMPLSGRIRTATSKAHRGLEARTGWPESLGGANDVSTMLQMFRALHAAVNEACACFEASFGQHGFASGSEDALPAIDDDLKTLGISEHSETIGFAPCADFNAALGLHYVASGSAMGNVLLLRHIAAHPDPSVAGASRFLKLSASRALPEFRSFRATLDLYGLREPTHASAVISGAEAAFHACVTWLDATARN